MARKKRQKPIKAESVLAGQLRDGKNIKELVGYIAINKEDEDGDPVYIQVKCKGLKTPGDDDSCSCDGLKVIGEVVGTGSLLTFNVCDWLDTLEELEEFSAKNRAKKQARLDYNEILNHHFAARKRIALMAYICDKLNKTDKTALEEDLGEKKLSLNTLSEDKIKDYAKAAVKIANKLTNDDLDTQYWH